MATGDDATAAGMALVPGTGAAKDLDTYDNQTRDYIAGGPAFWKPAVTPAALAQGGTGATTAPAARTNLGILLGNPDSAPASGALGTIPVYNATGQLTAQAPALSGHVATKGYVDSSSGGSSQANGPTSAAYNRNATGSGYYQVWMNSALQFMRNTSSRRYKKNVEALGDVLPLVLALQPVSYELRDESAAGSRVGFIAEDMAILFPEVVTFDPDGRPDAIDYGALTAPLVAAIQVQQRTILDLTARVEWLESHGPDRHS